MPEIPLSSKKCASQPIRSAHQSQRRWGNNSRAIDRGRRLFLIDMPRKRRCVAWWRDAVSEAASHVARFGQRRSRMHEPLIPARDPVAGSVSAATGKSSMTSAGFRCPRYSAATLMCVSSAPRPSAKAPQIHPSLPVDYKTSEFPMILAKSHRMTLIWRFYLSVIRP